MKNKFVLLCSLLVILSGCVHDTGAGYDLGFFMELEDGDSIVENDLNLYKFIHAYNEAIFNNFVKENLTLDEKAYILKDLYKNITSGNLQKVFYTHYEGTKSFVSNAVLAEVKEKEDVDYSHLLIFGSNYNVETDEIISDSSESEDAFLSVHLLLNGMLVNPYYFENEDFVPVEQLYEDKSYNTIADRYLFDGDDSNDSEIEELLDLAIAQVDDSNEFYYGHFTKVQYLLINGKADEALDLFLTLGEDVKLKIEITGQKRTVKMTIGDNNLDDITDVKNALSIWSAFKSTLEEIHLYKKVSEYLNKVEE